MFICFACTTAYMVKSRSKSAFGAWGGIGRHERRSTKNAIVGVLDTATHSRMARNSHSSSTSQSINTAVPTYALTSEREKKINNFLENPDIVPEIRKEIEAERKMNRCTYTLAAYDLCGINDKGYVATYWNDHVPTLNFAEKLEYPDFKELKHAVYWRDWDHHSSKQNCFNALVKFKRWQINHCIVPELCNIKIQIAEAAAQAIQEEKDARTIKIIGAIFSVIFFASYIFK